MVVRRVSHSNEGEEPVDTIDDPLLDNVTIRMSASRLVLDGFRPARGDIIRLIPFCSIVSQLRLLKSLFSVHKIPDKLQQILFGASFGEFPRLPDRQPPSSLQALEEMYEPMETIRARVDPGCLQYVDSLPANKCDP